MCAWTERAIMIKVTLRRGSPPFLLLVIKYSCKKERSLFGFSHHHFWCLIPCWTTLFCLNKQMMYCLWKYINYISLICRCWHLRTRWEVAHHVHLIALWRLSQSAVFASALRSGKTSFCSGTVALPFSHCLPYQIQQDMQKKYTEYRELSSSLHIWIRENMAVMQDRNFPNTLIEVKKLAHESNRFRTEEVPQRQREKQHIVRIFKDVEVYYSGTQLPKPYCSSSLVSFNDGI